MQDDKEFRASIDEALAEPEEEGFSVDEIRAEFSISKQILIVADPGPLIALAAADELAVLVVSEIPVELPDVVYWEVTRNQKTSRIVAWINEHSEMVRIVPTETGIDYQRRLEERRPTDGMDETAALETLRAFLEKYPLRQARFLFEKPGRRSVLDERVSLITRSGLKVLALGREVATRETRTLAALAELEAEERRDQG